MQCGPGRESADQDPEPARAEGAQRVAQVQAVGREEVGLESVAVLIYDAAEAADSPELIP
jgi:hypothetical protein